MWRSTHLAGKLGALHRLWLAKHSLCSARSLYKPNRMAGASGETGSALTINSLDKAAFDQKIDLMALRVPSKLVGACMKQLRSHLLNRPKMKNVAADTEESSRLVLLASELSSTALPEEVTSFMKDNGIEAPVPHSVTVGYELLTADQVLKKLLPDGMDVPTSFEQIGHIAHLNLREEHRAYKKLIGEVLLDKNPTLRTIVNKMDSIDTVFRTFKMEVLAGEQSLETEVHESGCRFKLNFERVYWNSRLQAEHRRIVSLLSKDDIVCDVFAGIGPFAVPAAKKGCVVYANDLNPYSFEYLTTNTKLNKVQGLLKPHNLDGREFVKHLAGSQTRFTHVVMNLPASAAEFLDVFGEAFANYIHPAPTVHCYCFSKHEDPCKDAVQQCEHALGMSINSPVVHDVRDVAPKKRMLCVSFKMPISAQAHDEARPEKKPKLDDNK